MQHDHCGGIPVSGLLCVSPPQSSGLLDRITTAWADTTAPLVREGAMLAFTAVCNDVGPPAEPFLLPLLDTLLSHYADKVLSSTSALLYVVLPHCYLVQ